MGLPPADASWTELQTSPVHIECTEHDGKPYCRSTAVIGAPVTTAASTFETLDQHVSGNGAIKSVTRLAPDVLHVVMDYPFPITDRDYIGRFTHTTDADGSEVYAWVAITDPAVPDDGSTVRLTWFEGEWRFAADGSNTRVTYLWEADPGGNLPDVAVVRKKAGYLAINDIAAACGTTILTP
jgi:hypothetical protein